MSKSLVYTYRGMSLTIFFNNLCVKAWEYQEYAVFWTFLKSLKSWVFWVFFWHWCSLVLPEYLKCNSREECTGCLVLTSSSGAILHTFRHINHSCEPIFVQCLWSLHYVAINVVLSRWCQRWYIWWWKFIMWFLCFVSMVETDRFDFSSFLKSAWDLNVLQSTLM